MHNCVGVIIGGVQHTDGRLQVKYWGVLTPVTPAALTPMHTGRTRFTYPEGMEG